MANSQSRAAGETVQKNREAPVKYWRKPLDADRAAPPLGVVHIIDDRCKGCAFCVEYCPKDVLVMSEAFNRKGYHPPEVVKAGLCLNCNLCEMICPEFAIFSVEAGQEVSAANASVNEATAREAAS